MIVSDVNNREPVVLRQQWAQASTARTTSYRRQAPGASGVKMIDCPEEPPRADVCGERCYGFQWTEGRPRGVLRQRQTGCELLSPPTAQDRLAVGARCRLAFQPYLTDAAPHLLLSLWAASPRG